MTPREELLFLVLETEDPRSPRSQHALAFDTVSVQWVYIYCPVLPWKERQNKEKKHERVGLSDYCSETLDAEILESVSGWSSNRLLSD